MVVYTPENWIEQLQQQAKLYCRLHVRLYTHSNQQKIVLPKLFNLYWKDFGESRKDMVVFIRDQFLPPQQQQELAFLDDPNAVVSIRYDESEWEFKFPIAEKLNNSDNQVYSPTISKEYVLLINQHHVYVKDTLSESEFAFIVPYQLLSLWQVQRRQKLLELGKSMGNSPAKLQCYEKMVQHIDMITQSICTYAHYYEQTGDYQGLTFRPSTYKKDKILQFVPINLQQQTMIVSNEPNYSTPLAIYSHVTVGAPSAHYHRYSLFFFPSFPFPLLPLSLPPPPSLSFPPCLPLSLSHPLLTTPLPPLLFFLTTLLLLPLPLFFHSCVIINGAGFSYYLRSYSLSVSIKQAH